MCFRPPVLESEDYYMKKECRYCGTSNEADREFCVKCAAKLTDPVMSFTTPPVVGTTKAPAGATIPKPPPVAKKPSIPQVPQTATKEE